MHFPMTPAGMLAKASNLRMWCTWGTISHGLRRNAGTGGKINLIRQEEQELADTRSIPPYAALRAFEALARFGGVRRAAQYLGVHHSVVSRHVTRLEAWLGVPLLCWSRKQFTLTDVGCQYHARISAALSDIDVATRAIIEPDAARTVRICCSTGLSTQWLAAQISEFEKGHPQIRIELRPSDAPANLLVHEAEVNIYLHLDDSPDNAAPPGLKAFTLLRPAVMLAASPVLAEQLSGISAPEDLLRFPLLHGNRRSEWRLWFKRQGVDMPEDAPGELCWNPHMALEAARLGRGVLLANRIFFERDLARGELVEVKVPGATDAAIGAYVFVAREDRWNTPAMVALRSFVMQRLSATREEAHGRVQPSNPN